jgi:GMP synthase-like glutamine amidotransferase
MSAWAETRQHRLLVFQHVAEEHPGSFRDFLSEQGVPWDVVELDDGEPIPDLSPYTGLWVMGGPMDVWQEEEYPWLVAEKAAIREAVIHRRLPYLGVCLGHQLLVDALGGEVGLADTSEIGIFQVDKTDLGGRSPLLEGLPGTMSCLQWHSAEVTLLPAGASTLMSSPLCAAQAVAVGGHALGVQFHLEVTPSTVSDWVAIPAYKAALEDNLGADGLSAFQAETESSLATMNAHARRLYDNWMGMAAEARSRESARA